MFFDGQAPEREVGVTGSRHTHTPGVKGATRSARPIRHWNQNAIFLPAGTNISGIWC